MQTGGARSGSGTSGLVLRTGMTFSVLALFLFTIGFVPEPTQTQATGDDAVTAGAPTLPEMPVTEPEVPEEVSPVRITIAAIDLDTTIIAPSSSDIDVLDRALLSGAVHYPGSAELSEVGNMLLFGHSSYLPIVHNKAYQAFNDLGKLVPGDTINVYSATHVHEYRVKQVRMVKAGDAQIAFDTDTPMLTLATCNTFGAKQDRWVVTAEWIQKEVYTES